MGDDDADGRAWAASLTSLVCLLVNIRVESERDARVISVVIETKTDAVQMNLATPCWLP